MREQKLAACEGVLASPSPRLIVLIETELDTGIANTVLLDLVGQPQAWCSGAAGLAATG
jgi:hypothetical protein